MARPMRSRQRSFCIIVGLVLAMLAVGVPGAGASSGNGVVTFFSGTGNAFNSCTNEIMNVTYRGSWVNLRVADGSGGGHYISVFSQTGSAVGESTGDAYRFNTTQSAVGNTTFDLSTDEYTAISNAVIPGLGTAPDLLMRATYHFTVANGTEVAYVYEASFECR